MTLYTLDWYNHIMKNTLENLGLDQTEARVYLALLELGPSTVSEVTSTADITRTLGYHVLEKLENYNLVKSVSRGTSSKKRYIAEHPEKVVQFVQDKKTSWERKLEEAQKNLPSLLSLYKIADKPTLKFSEGIEGVKSVSRGTLSAATPIISIVNLDIRNDEELITEIKETREKNKSIRTLVIGDSTWVSNLPDKINCRTVDPGALPGISDFIGELTIYENKLSIVSPTEFDYISFTIESELLTTLMKGMFHLAWLNGNPLV